MYRLVDGQAYYYYGKGFTGRQPLEPRWVHDTSPGAAASVSVKIPDPLEPDARFVRAGDQVVDGPLREHLPATRLSRLPHDLASMPELPPIGRVRNPDGLIQRRWLTGLHVWVDRHGVVRRIRIAAAENTTAPVYTITRDRNGTTIERRLTRVSAVAPRGRNGTETCIEGDVDKPRKVWHAVVPHGRGIACQRERTSRGCRAVEDRGVGEVPAHRRAADHHRTAARRPHPRTGLPGGGPPGRVPPAIALAIGVPASGQSVQRGIVGEDQAERNRRVAPASIARERGFARRVAQIGHPRMRKLVHEMVIHGFGEAIIRRPEPRHGTPQVRP